MITVFDNMYTNNMFRLYPYLESNQNLLFRRQSFYPLNYKGVNIKQGFWTTILLLPTEFHSLLLLGAYAFFIMCV